MIYTISKNFISFEEDQKRNYPNGGKYKTNAEERKDEESYYNKSTKRQKKGGALSSTLAVKDMSKALSKGAVAEEEYDDENEEEDQYKTKSKELEIEGNELIKQIEQMMKPKKTKESSKVNKKQLEQIEKPKEIKLLSKEDNEMLEAFERDFNSKRTANTKMKVFNTFENFYKEKMISAKAFEAIEKKFSEKIKEYTAKTKATPTNPQIKKAIKDLGGRQGESFEIYMTTSDIGKAIIKKITGSESPPILSTYSSYINQEVIVRKATENKPELRLGQVCVIDGYTLEACLEFKSRLKISFKELDKGDFIGLTTTKLSDNVSFELLFNKTDDGWKIKNIYISDKRNIVYGNYVDYMFDDEDENKDYYAIYQFKDCIAYYDITNDITDNRKEYDSGEKNILVKKFGKSYNFCEYRYEPVEGPHKTMEFPIPKSKFKPIKLINK